MDKTKKTQINDHTHKNTEVFTDRKTWETGGKNSLGPITPKNPLTTIFVEQITKPIKLNNDQVFESLAHASN